jgi:hypothetical protein
MFPATRLKAEHSRLARAGAARTSKIHVQAKKLTAGRWLRAAKSLYNCLSGNPAAKPGRPA